VDETPKAVNDRADELIRLFAIDGSRDDLMSLAQACEGFEDELSRLALLEIKRRAQNVPQNKL